MPVKSNNRMNLTTLTLCVVSLTPILISAASANANNVCPTWWDYWITRINSRCKYNDDIVLQLPAIAVKYGFPVEEHNVTTNDGYVLQLFRIKSTKSNAKSVLVVHGIYQNAFGWFSQGNDSLAYVLARYNYDVWVANLRGTKYSSLVNGTQNFWDFSIHEMGTQDYRAIVKYVYKIINNTKMLSINFSMGSTASLIYTSTFPEESNNYLERVVALAPIGYLSKMTSILAWLQYLWTPCKWFLQLFGVTNVLAPQENGWLPYLMFVITPINMFLYKILMGLVFGFDLNQFNPWTLPILVSRSGDAIAVNVIEHYVQIIRSNVFKALDYYSKQKNIKYYGTAKPPVYNLSDVQVPFTFICGQNDAIATAKNVLKTYQFLPTTNDNCLIELGYKRFNHQDFVMAKDVNDMLYKPLAESWLKGICPQK